MSEQHNIPYVTAYGNITRALEGIQKAQTPDRFTLDFLSTKLGMKGGGARPVLPFLKKTGFLGSDGSPTDQYKRFRNAQSRKAAAADGLQKGFSALYQINDYVHDAKDSELRGIVVQASGAEVGSSTVKSIIGSFKALRSFASFDESSNSGDSLEDRDEEAPVGGTDRDQRHVRELNLGYTINLNLPATSDIAVFNAIFKSLRDNLLD